MARCVLHAEIHTIQENCNGAIPLIGVGFRNATNGADNSGVVEHDVNTPEFFDSKINSRSNLIFVRDIGVDVSGVGAELFGQCKTRFILDVGDDDFGAFFNESTNSPGTDTACGSGDDCNFVL